MPQRGLFLFVFLDEGTGILSAKAEVVGKSGTDGTFLCLSESKVEAVVDVLIVITLLMVDSGRNDVVLHSQHGGNGFNGTGSTQQMARHRLCGIDVELVGMFAEYILNSQI